MTEREDQRLEREAIEKVESLLALPMPKERYDIGTEGTFDPWEMLPFLYGTYSGDFDECALDVLRELRDRKKRREDLGAEMFREMLCNLHLCDYGSSPRVCFPTPGFNEQLPRLIEKWEEFSRILWAEDADS